MSKSMQMGQSQSSACWSSRQLGNEPMTVGQRQMQLSSPFLFDPSAAHPISQPLANRSQPRTQDELRLQQQRPSSDQI